MLIRADARRIPLRDACVDTVVTSPPYWGLRDYGDVRQIGLQHTPDAYIAALCDVFDEVWRILKPEGTCFVNLGDTYQNAKGQAHGVDPKQPARRHGLRPQDIGVPGLKPKDMVGVPWMFAFEARRRGWDLRSDIIWSKPNPMPESGGDRPTKSHEYVFLLSKSERYFYDADAIREPYAASTLREFDDGYDGFGLKDYEGAGVQNPSDVKQRIIANARAKAKGRGGMRSSDIETYGLTRGGSNPSVTHPNGANKRSVWTIPTIPYRGAHFATFPETLVEPCILAGCPLSCCAKCGTAVNWARVNAKVSMVQDAVSALSVQTRPVMVSFFSVKVKIPTL